MIMDRFRIAIFAYNHPESTLPLVKHLAKQGHSVDYYFVTSSRQEGSSAFSFGRKVWMPGLRGNNKKYMVSVYNYMESENVQIYLVVLPPYALRYLYFLSRFIFFSMGFFLRKMKYDFINIVGQNRPLVDLLKSLGGGPSIFISLHEVTPHYASQDVNFGLIEYLLENDLNVIVHSKASYEKLVQHGVTNPEFINIIPFGVFETYALFTGQAPGIHIADKYILYYGSILPYKGLDVLYGAVQELGTRLGDFKIVVAGHGEDPCLEKMLHDKRFIVINRYLTNNEIVLLNQAAHFIVCPYKSASQSGIVSTSYFFSKPIVASNVGGFKEYIVHEENGLLVEPDDVIALADSFNRLISDDIFYNRLCSGASMFSKSPKYAWDAIAKEYLDIFQGSIPVGERSRT
jgi:glycosyltransferase involved in cell wall biosynthesis